MPPAPEPTPAVLELQRKTAASGALLFAIGIVTGAWSAAALTSAVKVTIPHLALAAHLNGLLGGFWLICLAWTLPMLRFGEVGLRRVVIMVALSCYANWLVTVLASMLGVDGLQFTKDVPNDVIALLLHVTVVIPALIGSIGWAWGFFRKQG